MSAKCQWTDSEEGKEQLGDSGLSEPYITLTLTFCSLDAAISTWRSFAGVSPHFATPAADENQEEKRASGAH